MHDSGAGTVEIVHTVARKRWTSSQKMSIAEETMQPGYSVSRMARKHGVSPALPYQWRKLMPEGSATAVAADDQVASIAEVTSLKKAHCRIGARARRKDS